MAKTKQQKEQSLQVLVDGIKNSKSVVFANFQGLKVLESEELRSICREQNITYVASKKTLLKKALTDAGKYIDTVKVTELSQLPNKQQMLGQLVGTLNAPISGFVNVLAGNLRGLVNVLNGIKESKV